MTARGIAALLLASAALSVAACGTDARGIDTCRRIEEVRCQRAPSCGISLDFIKHVGSSEADAVEGCVRYYRDACLHGLVADEPGAIQVEACTGAIQNGSCDVVKAPETAPECGWLVPPPPPAPPPEDAGAPPDDAPAEDGGA